MERMRDFLRSGIPWPWARDRQADGYPTVPSWPVRHPITSALISIAAIVAVAVPVYKSVTSSPCGPGLTAIGSPYICVGLDLHGTPMLRNDPLSDLEEKITAMDSRLTGQFATIVLLADLTPDSNDTTEPVRDVRHIIEGAITAVNSANNSDVADGPLLPIKLLLANFGSNARWWKQAVAAIEGAQRSQHIVAVTGIGQSLDTTRAAVNALSDDQITTIGSDVTADNMNKNLAGQPIPDFFRVVPTNTDEADIAVRYIQDNLHHPKIMLIRDLNPTDDYARTLTSAFQKKLGHAVLYLKSYTSPPDALVDNTRSQVTSGLFAQMQPDICADQPNLIYFAGRGFDLLSFLQALAVGGCPLPFITVMTGDDASNLIGKKIPAPPTGVRVLFTALATGGEWSSSAKAGKNSALFAEASGYRHFATAFKRNGFDLGDLDDGEAMTEYDAVLTAAKAVREDKASAIANPGTVAEFVRELNGFQTVRGASGLITICANGNTIDKVMPVLQIKPNGTTTPKAPPEGPSGPLDYLHHTC